MEKFVLNICLLSPDILLRSFSYVLYSEAIVNVVLHLISTTSSLLFITHLNIGYVNCIRESIEILYCRKTTTFSWSELVAILRIDFSSHLVKG